MSWNEPGGDKKDPWSGRNNDQKSPPDLDEVLRSLQEKLSGIFGGGGSNSNNATSGGAPLKTLGYLAAGAALLWGLSGFYTVDEGTKGIVTRFGAYVSTTQPGLNWHIPAPIEQYQIVNVEQQRFIEVGYRSGGGQATGSVPKEAMMLTKDENIVDVRLAVQYQVKDAKDYAFNVYDPASTLKQVTESVERGVIGHSDMDFVLTEGRSEIVMAIKSEIQSVMDAYKTGILITSVNLQDAQPPEQVQGSFEDAIKAREDKQRLINEAEAYSNDVVPKSRGAASRIVQEAEAYKERVIAQADGDVSRFSQLLTEYKKAPGVTKQRMYIEAMESVLGRSNNILVDVKGGNNILYLPLDKLNNKTLDDTPPPVISHEQISSATAPIKEVKTDTRVGSRERDVRGRNDGK